MRWLGLTASLQIATLLLSGCLYAKDTYEERKLELVDSDGDGFRAIDDCDDDDPTIYPGAPESCNGEDDDCDGEIDGANARDQQDFYRDLDGDSWGDGERGLSACEAPEDYVPRDGDCDDFDRSAFPGGVEICDLRDNDCDGVVDGPKAVDAFEWYRDADADRYGEDGSEIRDCARPEGYVLVGGDCNDKDSLVHPNAAELCDAVDQNCDGDPELGAVDAGTWFIDVDSDGYGDITSSERSCTQLAGRVAVGGDCDDQNPNVRPGLAEVCDLLGVDEDCNGLVNEADPGALDRFDAYVDDDGDGFGRTATAVAVCELGPDQVAFGGDCDDANAEIRPDAAEVALDGIDQNCDGVDGCLRDVDGDGYGGLIVAPAGPEGCLSQGLSGVGGDCNDTDANISPDGVELPGDGVDQDCNGRDTCWRDADGDGIGSQATTQGAPAGCAMTVGASATTGDCDDSDSGVYPGAQEIAGDGRDQDCDNVDSCFQDFDQDGFGAGLATPGTSMRCEDDPLLASVGGDCAPTDERRFPGAVETPGDGVDQNCDGVDSCYLDEDQDGVGGAQIGPGQAGQSCALLVGYSSLTGDCDDQDPSRAPGKPEVWYDGVDSDCSGGSDYDQDRDGFDARSAGGVDCVDTDPLIYPGLARSLRVPEDFDSVQEAVDAACDSDRVRIGAGSWPGNVDATDRVVSIEARTTGTATLVGDGTGPVLKMDAGSAIGLIISGGRAVDGACVQVALNEPVVLRALSLSDCQASGRGGGVYAAGPSSLLIDGLVAKLNGAFEGGAVYLDGVADATVNGLRTESNATTACSALAQVGGGLMLHDAELRSGVGAGGICIGGVANVGELALLGLAGDGVVVRGAGQADLSQVTALGLGGALIYAPDAGAQTSLERFVVAFLGGGIIRAPLGGTHLVGEGIYTSVGTTPFEGLPDDPIADGRVKLNYPYVMRYSSWLPVAQWDAHLLDISSAVDADPVLLDPDGSPADFGAYGGPLAVGFSYYDDVDADLMPDGWERSVGLVVGVQDGQTDQDGDLLDAATELYTGTFPLVLDSDGDGFDDGVEVSAGSDPLDPAFHP